MNSLNNGFVILDGTTIPQLQHQLKLKYGSVNTDTENSTNSYTTTGYTTAAICSSSQSQYNFNDSVYYRELRSELVYASPSPSPVQSFPPSNLAVLPKCTAYVPKVVKYTQQSFAVARNPIYDEIPPYSLGYQQQGFGSVCEKSQTCFPLLHRQQDYNNEDCSFGSQTHSLRSPPYDSDEENRGVKRRRCSDDIALVPRNFHYGRHIRNEYSYDYNNEPKPARVLCNPHPAKKKFRASYPPTFQCSSTKSTKKTNVETTGSPIYLRAAVQTPASLYHYTSSDGAFGILSDEFLKPKEEASRFGIGIYFTAIPPTESTESILINNYGSGKIFLSQFKNTEFVFEFPSKNLPDLVLCEDYSTMTKTKEIRRYIWMSRVTKLDLKLGTGSYSVRDVSGFDVPQSIETHKIHFRRPEPDPPRSRSRSKSNSKEREGSESPPIPVIDLD